MFLLVMLKDNRYFCEYLYPDIILLFLSIYFSLNIVFVSVIICLISIYPSIIQKTPLFFSLCISHKFQKSSTIWCLYLHLHFERSLHCPNIDLSRLNNYPINYIIYIYKHAYLHILHVCRFAWKEMILLGYKLIKWV